MSDKLQITRVRLICVPCATSSLLGLPAGMFFVTGCTCVAQVLHVSGPVFVHFRFFSVCFRSFIQFVHFSTDKIKNEELATIYNKKLRN
ncbi:hypothetical protein QL285_051456 [Trifolium repens]|nr:hypothetical protein QL285_051456 [Trifolium repens]